MKNIGVTCFQLAFWSLAFVMQDANATTRTVNNATSLPVNPGQYTTINAAMSASSAGDTILVAGSSIMYNEDVYIDKRLTLIGAGYNPQYQVSTYVNGRFIIFNIAASGSAIMGFVAKDCHIDASGTSNVTIARNYFFGNQSYLLGMYGDYYQDGGINISNSVSNITIAKNVINYGIKLNNLDIPGLVIKNNILFSGFTVSGSGIGILTAGNTASTAQQIVIDHNLFIDGSYSSPTTTTYGVGGALQTRNALVTNNIFYNINPIDTNNSSSYTNNTFDKNLTFASTALKPLPWGGNTGSGNLNNQDPQFTSIFSNGAFPYLDFKNDNLRPASGSPIINAANDGTNIGPTGGYYPIYSTYVPWLTGEPPMPEVKSITITGSNNVPAGTTLSIQVKAKKIN